MAYQKIEDLPQEVREQLPEYGQRVFIAAFNSIAERSGDEEAANRVAWQTIKRSQEFVRGEDGKWHQRKDFPSYGKAGAPNLAGN
ncbi:MAG: ChaB family protein [Cyanosarcina radialis HA8281-LM2]|jgi:cation transport regulator|nr:ChaB family protein [Cyanosarcina radialis HA8281-LM2]